jgi:microcystin-dependent protein
MSYYTINNNSITTPPGSIIAYIGSTSPSGWFICNGSAISRITYSDLFAVLGTNFGVGNGSTTFNLPDYRGAFLRGTGSQTKNYNSTNITYTGPGINSTGQSHSTQVHAHDLTGTISYGSSNTYNYSGMTALSPNNNNGNSFNLNNNLSISNSTTSGGTITDTTETRPFNFGINWIIKF